MKTIAHYKLRDITIDVYPSEREGYVSIHCRNTIASAQFEISHYEFTHYKHLLHRKISYTFSQHKKNISL